MSPLIVVLRRHGLVPEGKTSTTGLDTGDGAVAEAASNLGTFEATLVESAPPEGGRW